jgi:hypothetical protein
MEDINFTTEEAHGFEVCGLITASTNASKRKIRVAFLTSLPSEGHGTLSSSSSVSSVTYHNFRRNV